MADEQARREAVASITNIFTQITQALNGAPRVEAPESPESLRKLLVLKTLEMDATEGVMDAEKARQALASLGMPDEMLEQTVAYLEMTATLGEEYRAQRDQEAVKRALAERATIAAVAPGHFTRQ